MISHPCVMIFQGLWGIPSLMFSHFICLISSTGTLLFFWLNRSLTYLFVGVKYFLNLIILNCCFLHCCIDTTLDLVFRLLCAIGCNRRSQHESTNDGIWPDSIDWNLNKPLLINLTIKLFQRRINPPLFGK